MTQLLFVLLVVAALAVVVRIVQSRSTIGVALIGVIVLGAMAGMAWHFSDALPAIGAARAAAADDESPDAVADDSTASAPSSEENTLVPAEGTDGTTIETKASSVGGLVPSPPDWVESENVITGDVHSVVVTTGPHAKESDCRQSLDEELEKAVDAYIDEYLGKVYGDKFKVSTFVNYDIEYIKSKLRKETYKGVRAYSVGPMHEMYALLEFDASFREEIEKRSHQTITLTGTGLAVGFILALLAVVFGYFRLDTATRGYYTRRLKLASAVVILTLVVVGLLLAKHIL